MNTDRVATTKVHDINHVPNPKKPDTMARTESDSHSDTTLSVNNTTLLSYTGYECNVNVIHSDLKQMEKIPVAMEVTAQDNPLSGTTVMLVFNQELWFGISMRQSLITTIQVCLHGIQLSEYPYDQNIPLEIVYHDSDWYIPFTVKRTLE